MMRRNESIKNKKLTALFCAGVKLEEIAPRFECDSFAPTARGKACVECVREVGGAGAEGVLRAATII